ncbi:hypothetical protein D3C87_1495450 [compost metagenome]
MAIAHQLAQARHHHVEQGDVTAGVAFALHQQQMAADQAANRVGAVAQQDVLQFRAQDAPLVGQRQPGGLDDLLQRGIRLLVWPPHHQRHPGARAGRVLARLRAAQHVGFQPP